MTSLREGMEVGNEGENCLVLNVYTPDASSRRKPPVMVWLHGGGAKVSAVLAMRAAKGLFHKVIVQSGPGIVMTEKSKAAEHAERTLEKLGLEKVEVHKLRTLDHQAIISAALAASAAMVTCDRG